MKKNSATNKILALLVAVFLWAYVMAVEKPLMTVTFENIPIQIENEATLTAAGLAIAETSELTTGVVVEGQRSDFKSFTADNISASINVMGYSQGKYLLQVNVKVSDEVNVKEIRTPKIQVSIEPLLTESKPVEVNVMNLSEGTEEGDMTIAPQEIEVSGARSRVKAVRAVQVTLDASQLAEKGRTVQLSGTAVDAEGLPVDYVTLSGESVDVTAKLYRTKEVDLEVKVQGAPGNGLELSGSTIPTRIVIKGPKNVLKDIDSIEAETIDISGITDNTTIKIRPQLPDETEVARASADLAAVFNLRDIVRKEFTYASDEITIEGLSSDYTLAIDTPSIRVMASGSAGVMSMLKKTDLAPMIRAGEVDASTSQLPVVINHNINLNSLSVSPSVVNVTVERAAGSGAPEGGTEIEPNTDGGHAADE